MSDALQTDPAADAPSPRWYYVGASIAYVLLVIAGLALSGMFPHQPWLRAVFALPPLAVAAYAVARGRAGAACAGLVVSVICGILSYCAHGVMQILLLIFVLGLGGGLPSG